MKSRRRPLLRVAVAQIPETAVVVSSSASGNDDVDDVSLETDDVVLETHRKAMERAKRSGADLVVFPEMSLVGYTIGANRIRSKAESRGGRNQHGRNDDGFGPLLSSIQKLARTLSVAVCVGYAEKEEEEDFDGTTTTKSTSISTTKATRIYNAVAVFDAEGKLVHHYRKTHLYGEYEFGVFTPGGAEELRRVSTLCVEKTTTTDDTDRIDNGDDDDDDDNDEGDDTGTKTTTTITIELGVMVCMDCEYPEPARLLALHGAELILLPTALGYGPVMHVTPRCVVPTRALENHVFVAYSNYCGNEASAATSSSSSSSAASFFVGQSAIVGPDGVDLARAPGVEAIHRTNSTGGSRDDDDDDGVDGLFLITADIDREAFVADVRRNPYLKARRPELYSALIETNLPPNKETLETKKK